MTWAGVAAGLKTKVPVILTEHGSSHVRGASPLVRIASWLVDKTVGRWSLRMATTRLAVSSESARFVQRLAGKSADVFLNAINLDFWRVASAEKPQRFVFVGRIVPDKGWDESVRAFEIFQLRNPSSEYELHIAGDGPEFERLAGQVDASQAKEKIFVHGRQSHEQVRFLLKGQWLINPTTLAEGFQTTLIEAAVCNAGIISYEVPGLNELSNSGATILRASSFENLSAQMEACLKIVPSSLSEASAENWGWGVRAKQYLEKVKMASCPWDPRNP
ncbi:glycosyltransferase involved in cell wall biosynthesis [Aurantimicrobium minutum]|nr:glycosyltransferase involved in cell wall biosynthesis [Aurantimicrobium minutum]